MRLLQIIDSLEAGGAERMAVNFYNYLNGVKGIRAFLVATRKEGILKKELKIPSNYLYLGRKRAIDIKAILKLVRFAKEKSITHVHAHGSSYFIGSMLKLAIPKLVFIWHDHYGNSEFLNERRYSVLKLCSNNFDGIIAVNKKLADWNSKKLNCTNCTQINNFVQLAENADENVKLEGNQKVKLICVANFRPQKNHLFLLNVIAKLSDKDLSLHLFGKHFNDEYGNNILELIEKMTNVFYYGSKPINREILNQASIGILVSKSEGLPLVLLEYAEAQLAVICTDVGECKAVIEDTGIIINSGNEDELLAAINSYAEDSTKLNSSALKFHELVKRKFGAEKIIKQTIEFYKRCS
ncbi:glycosyltransferase family 4 protein [Zunongwangia endophytica]|uniref:Glycosyltransferase family 4 protein n=1 Tax=Zunongwangia endophytica TaxID=1808945 RepID=A0ABV8H605_9FLAO|nr:glycosyltransferase family 4 protein [Zunongwangia endophytica]MDN3595024.1 glycosyltransferase family 4 protein [Zunongwangia endophytica]